MTGEKMKNIEKTGYRPIAIKIYSKEKQLILEDEILCAYDTRTNAILAIGKAAMSYIQDDHVAVVNPLKWGVVADYPVFCKVMTHYIKKLPTSFAKKPKLVLCVPAKLTEVEKTAFTEAILESGGGKPFYMLEYSFEQLFTKGLDVNIKGENYYIELVSEYYNSEYFN